MLLLTLMDRVLDEVPEADVSGFVATVNREVRSLWGRRVWSYYQADVSMGVSHSFVNLTLTPGASTTAVVDGDAGGLFDTLHVGKVFTIGGVGYLVQSVTDSNTLTVTGVVVATSPAAGSLPRVVYSLPSNFRRMVKVFRSEEEGDTLRDPDDYALELPTSSGTRLIFARVLAGSVTYTVRYFREPTAVTGLDSTVDVSEAMEDAIFWGLAKLYQQKVAPGDEFAMLPWQRRVSEYERERELAVNRAQKEDRLRRRFERRNAPVMFRH